MTWMPPRISQANARCLLDHRPDAGDELEVPGASVVAFQAQGDQSRLIDGGRLPLRHAVDRVLLEPVEKRTMRSPHLVEPDEDSLADLGVSQALQSAAYPESISGPAIGAKPPVQPGSHSAMLGVGVERGGQGRPSQAHRVGSTGKMKVGERLDESIPLLGCHLLDVV